MSALSKMVKSQIEFLLKDSNDAIVAKQFKVTRQAVFHIRQKFGIPSSRYRAKEKKETIVDLRRNGIPVSKISAITKMSESYIYKVLKGYKNGARIQTSDENIE